MITDPDLIKYNWPTYEGMKPQEEPPFDQPCTGQSPGLTAKEAYETYVMPGAEFVSEHSLLLASYKNIHISPDFRNSIEDEK